MSIQGAAAAEITGNVTVDPLVAGQAGTTGNLFGTVVESQLRFSVPGFAVVGAGFLVQSQAARRCGYTAERF
jgi:hypothetical protein